MKGYFYLSSLIVGFILACGTSFAATTDCEGMNGALTYKSYSQEGGPCCGRSNSEIKFNGTVLKTTTFIGGSNSAGTTKDSNLNLVVAKTDYQEKSNQVSGTTRTVTYTEVLSLKTKDGQPALPDGDSNSERSIVVSCVAISSTIQHP